MGRPRPSATPNGFRVSADVGGVEVWFESPDVPLRASAEAYAAAFLIPALATRRRLELQELVAPEFAANCVRVCDLVRRWWRLRALSPLLHTRPVDADPQVMPRSGLLFSGGADSLFTLLASGRHVDTLILVQGFDIPLDDTGRAERAEATARDVGAATAKDVIVVRSNLRTHPAFRTSKWEWTHGGALAAVGHVLGDELSAVLISSSNPRSHPAAWGSHWDLDPLWSGAGLAFEHVGAEFTRMQKLTAIAGEPLAQRHLRVCWENRTSSLNCSRCEKCIRTRIALVVAGALDRFEVFEPAETLVGRVDALPYIKDPVLFERYETAVEQGLPRHLSDAVTRLLSRSRRQLWRERWSQTVRRGSSLARRISGGHRRPELAGQ